jgi:hypothetical protein
VSRVFRRFRYLAITAVVLLGLVYAFYPPFQASVRDNLAVLFHTVEPSLQPVHPDHITANLQTPGHDPGKVADEYTDTYWSAPWNGQDQVTLTFDFDRHVILRSIILRSGISNDFVAHGRPSVIRVSYSDGKTTTLTPDDTEEAQTLSLNNSSLIDSVTMTIADVYDSQPTTRDVAISEIEFYALK